MELGSVSRKSRNFRARVSIPSVQYFKNGEVLSHQTSIILLSLIFKKKNVKLIALQNKGMEIVQMALRDFRSLRRYAAFPGGTWKSFDVLAASKWGDETKKNIKNPWKRLLSRLGLSKNEPLASSKNSFSVKPLHFPGHSLTTTL